MNSIRKFILTIRHFSVMSWSSPMRNILISVGIFASVALFGIAHVLSSSYYTGQFDLINEMTDNSVVLRNGTFLSQITNKVYDTETGVALDCFLENKKYPLISKNCNLGNLIVNAQITYLNKISDILPELSESYDFIPLKRKLVRGRFFKTDDTDSHNNAVIIDEFTAEMLFNTIDCVGYTFSGTDNLGDVSIFYQNKQNIEYTIVGVVENSSRSEAYSAMIERIDCEPGETVVITMPVWVLKNDNDVNDCSFYRVCLFDDSGDYSDFLVSVNYYKLISDGIGESLKWSTKASLIENETRVMRNVKSVLLFGESVLVFFSGICLMGVLLFSIKERVPEIGVRKAFGAGKADIVFLILFESVLVGIITSFFAVCASFYICKTAEYIIVSKMHILFSIRFSFSDFLLPILIGIAETVMLSIGPAVKASKINASDAVRFV